VDRPSSGLTTFSLPQSGSAAEYVFNLPIRLRSSLQQRRRVRVEVYGLAGGRKTDSGSRSGPSGRTASGFEFEEHTAMGRHDNID
jgi:hypothetical protein